MGLGGLGGTKPTLCNPVLGLAQYQLYQKGFFLHPGEPLGFKGDALGKGRVPGGPCCPRCLAQPGQDLAGRMLILTGGFHGFSPFA